jgi:UDP-N-acetylmuramoyl-L-alanyl-D-glutamate--2,6-diaminopimelate ligase
MRALKKSLRSLAPAPILSAYHFCLAYLGALCFGFPSRNLVVIGVTGTNGKSSTTEFINAIFEAAGYKTALSNSIRVKVGDETRGSSGRSMPGRFFIQRFFRQALDAKCTVAIVEMTSEGVKQHRHRGISLDCLVFTNLAPEHIESHGSYEAYADAKFELGKLLARSGKRPRIMVANAEDAQGSRYLALPVEKAVGFKLPVRGEWQSSERGGRERFAGVDIAVNLPGEFYIKNALAAAEAARAFGIDTDAIKRGIESIRLIPGRMEEVRGGQEFGVIVDYALTPDALEALYKTYGDKKKICVFGLTGGGRDKWKRPVIGQLAERFCETVILTNDIAYDEDPHRIVEDIAHGMRTKKPEIIFDRRAAIRRACELAQAHAARKDVVVLITGMGIDTEITGADGKKITGWSDAQVAREELQKLLRV